MPPIDVRPFRRSDRDQLTHLVNTHAEAVVPGMGVSVSALLTALERRPGEFIEDPWVSERLTLVAEQRHRVAAAAHLLRFFADERAGEAARDVGEIHWLLFWPQAPAGNPCWPDATEAAGALIGAAIGQLDRWGVTRQHAGGELPLRGVYGVPEQWPHISALYERAGFTHTGHTEIVYLARVEDLPQSADPPVAGQWAPTAAACPPSWTARSSATSRWRPSARANGCRGMAAGPTSAASMSASGIAAGAWRHGCSGRRRTGCGWRRSAASSTTPGWRAPTQAAWTTPVTGPSSRRPGSGS